MVVGLNGWVFVNELSGCRFEFGCSHLDGVSIFIILNCIYLAVFKWFFIILWLLVTPKKFKTVRINRKIENGQHMLTPQLAHT